MFCLCCPTAKSSTNGCMLSANRSRNRVARRVVTLGQHQRRSKSSKSSRKLRPPCKDITSGGLLVRLSHLSLKALTRPSHPSKYRQSPNQCSTRGLNREAASKRRKHSRTCLLQVHPTPNPEAAPMTRKPLVTCLLLVPLTRKLSPHADEALRMHYPSTHQPPNQSTISASVVCVVAFVCRQTPMSQGGPQEQILCLAIMHPTNKAWKARMSRSVLEARTETFRLMAPVLLLNAGLRCRPALLHQFHLVQPLTLQSRLRSRLPFSPI
jgi:hypothetical protein